MCGIAGALSAAPTVENLLRGVGHRGPDHEGSLTKGSLALGAARLRIRGDQRSDMPLVSKSGQIAMVMNGEIFNHQELVRKSDGQSDLCGLPDLFEQIGPQLFSKLRGPFAIVVADFRDESLYLARDEVGVRPLFFSTTSQGVSACSEIAPLLKPSHPRDLEAWRYLLAFQFWPKGHTPYEGVHSLPPGHWTQFQRHGAIGSSCEFRLQAQGAFQFSAGIAAQRTDAVQGLSHALRQSFELQAEREHRAAVTLSGGLDSSAVLGGLAAAGAPCALAATGYFQSQSPGFDERLHARAVAEQCGVPLVEVEVTPADFLEVWPKVLHHLGGPLAGPGAMSQYIVARRLASEGVKVVFSGTGGDELFGGYERHRLIQMIEQKAAPLQASPGYEPLQRKLEQAMADGQGLSTACLFRAREYLEYLNPGLALQVLDKIPALPVDGPGLADRLLHFEAGALLPGLLAVDDRTLAAFGMEGRVPLLDPVVFQLATKLPLANKSPANAPRAFFRKATRSYLPEAAARRDDKMGFPVPLNDWIDGPWRSFLQDHPSLDSLQELGFKPEAVLALRAGRIRGRSGWFLISAALGFGQTIPQSSSSAMETVQ